MYLSALNETRQALSWRCFFASSKHSLSLYFLSFWLFFQARAMRCGCSRLARNLSRNLEANSSSTSRPSLDSVTVINCWVRRVWSSSHSCSSVLEVPMARIQAWGGLITALKPLTPNIPRLDILPPRHREEMSREKQHFWSISAGVKFNENELSGHNGGSEQQTGSVDYMNIISCEHLILEKRTLKRTFFFF